MILAPVAQARSINHATGLSPMSDGKKDLTRIEDLASFFHEEEAENPPDLPMDEDVPPFDPSPFEETSPFEEAPSFTEASNFDEAPSFESDMTVEENSNVEEAPSFDEASRFETDTTVDEGPYFADTPENQDEKEIEELEVSPSEDLPVDLPTQASPPAPNWEPAPAAENFAEVRAFAERAVLADLGSASNPAYSVMVRNLRFAEDLEDVLEVLQELKFPADMMEQFRRQLERGSLLVPRVSEFTATYLCHRLKRYRLDLQSGPSDLIHPPRQADASDTKGLVSRRSLSQNQHHAFHFREAPNDARSILLSTLPQLDGHVIERYLGVASEHALLEASSVEDETSEVIQSRYQDLALKLKGHALEKRANAVVGVNYQLTPLPSEPGVHPHVRYRLTCTGNLVWVNRMAP